MPRRRLHHLPLELLLACAAIGAYAPVVAAQPAGDTGRKSATAVSLAGASIRVDGRLDEEVWLKAQPITDFTQKEPT